MAAKVLPFIRKDQSSIVPPQLIKELEEEIQNQSAAGQLLNELAAQLGEGTSTAPAKTKAPLADATDEEIDGVFAGWQS